MATAYEAFFEIVAAGKLVPAAVSVQSADGLKVGLVSMGMDYDDPAARDIVLSPDPRVRAVAAYYAVSRTIEHIEKNGTLALRV